MPSELPTREAFHWKLLRGLLATSSSSKAFGPQTPVLCLVDRRELSALCPRSCFHITACFIYECEAKGSKSLLAGWKSDSFKSPHRSKSPPPLPYLVCLKQAIKPSHTPRKEDMNAGVRSHLGPSEKYTTTPSD